MGKGLIIHIMLIYALASYFFLCLLARDFFFLLCFAIFLRFLFLGQPIFHLIFSVCCLDGASTSYRSSASSFFSALEALKAGVTFGGTETRSPVFGFRAVRAGRFLTAKEPKPRSSTLSPCANASVIVSRTASTTLTASFCVRLCFFAIERAKSALVISYNLRAIDPCLDPFPNGSRPFRSNVSRRSCTLRRL